MRKLVSVVFAAVAGVLSCLAVATDGTLMNYNTDTDNLYHWKNRTKAGDGGTMYVDGNYGSPGHWVTIGSSMTLNGIFHNNRGLLSYTGQAITLTGDPAVMDMPVPYAHDNEGFNRRSAWLDVPVSGTGANTYVKRGGGKWSVKYPLANFAEVYVEDGCLAATNFDGTAVTECPLRIGSAALGYQPDYRQTGGDYAATASSTGVKIESGAQISINRVNASSAALTVGPLTRLDGGSLLVRPSRDVLGATERLLVQGGSVPQSSKGVVAPWIATRRASETGQPVHFLEYDATVGFRQFSSCLASFGSSTKDDCVQIAAATTLTDDAAAAAVEVNNAEQLVVNGTLTLGDGTNPGGLALNATTTATTTFEGSGTIDFGDRPGHVWRGAPSGALLMLATKFKGSAGVTIAAGGTADAGTESPATQYGTVRPTVVLGAISSNAYVEKHIFDGVTGGIRLSGCTFRFGRGSFGPNDVYVDGANHDGYASMEYWDYATGSITNHFHVRGDYSLNVNGGKAGNGWTFDAPFSLMGDTMINPLTQFLQFNRTIDGTGNLTLMSAYAALNEAVPYHCCLYAANTYAGRTILIGKSATKILKMALYGSATFGTGAVSADAYTSILLSGLTGYEMSPDFDSLGEVTIANSTVSFLGKTSFASTTLSDSTVGIGADVALGTTLATSGTFQPAATASRLTVSGDSALGARLADVDGRTLDLVKTGSGTLTVSAPVGSEKNTAKGTLRVEEGTVKLVSDPRLSAACVVWIDMDDDACVTLDGDTITGFRSKSAVSCTFSSENSASGYANMTRSGTADGINGHRTAQSTGVKSSYVADAAKTFRTVFIVYRPAAGMETSSMRGIFGFSNDIGIRTDIGTSCRWANKIGHSFYSSGADNLYMYTNGVWGSGFKTGEPQILELRVPQSDSTNVRGTPRFPRYSGSDPFLGDIGEILAFESELSDDEFDFVNDYLAKKWLGATKEPALAESAVLAPETKVELTTGSVLDLCGVNQTVASVTGKGTITNSSDTAATLTVTGAFDGTIRVGAGVNVVHRDAATYRVYNDGPATNGLSYWFDASKRETIVTNAAGCVTNWASRLGTVKRLFYDPTLYRNGIQLTPPDYVAADATFGGRPAIRFDSMYDSLISPDSAEGKSVVRTIFVVKYDSAETWTSAGNPFAWSHYYNSNAYYGLFFSGANNTGGAMTYNNCRPMSYENYDDRLVATFADKVVEKADELGGGLAIGPYVGTPYVISARIGDGSACWNSPARAVLGSHDMMNGRWQTVAEVVAYDRALSDGEMESVEAYLIEKWTGEGGLPAETDTVALGGTVTVTVNDDGTVAPVVVEGKLDASQATLAVTNAKKVPKGSPRDLVVTEGVTEGFAATAADSKRLLISLKDGLKYIGQILNRGTAVFVR